jgi:hypothetical protein
VAVAAISPALTVLARGLNDARSREDNAAASLANDPSDLSAIVDLSVTTLGIKAMAATLRTVEETDQSVIDLLA